MAIAYPVSLRNARLNEVRDDIDGGSAAGYLRIYNGTRPAAGGATTTLLAELRFSDPSFGNASNGTLTANSITSDSSANASGTATWFRATDSNGNFVIDGDVGATGSDSDLELNTTTITAGQFVSITSFVITENNA